MRQVGFQELAPLEKALGVSFQQKRLLQQALVHGSYFNENPGLFAESNERMEFLGDAVLGIVSAHELFRTNPGWHEGELTQARVAVVRGDYLAAVAAGLDLGRHLYMGRGEDAGGGRDRLANLAAALEAVVGALFLDQGYDAAQDLVVRLLFDETSEADLRAVAKDAKSALQEAVQGRGDAIPAYSIVETAGSDHDRRFTAEVTVSGKVLGRGTGSRKSLAEQAAAKEALKGLG